jgi:outer membrane protein insertion porin family
VVILPFEVRGPDGLESLKGEIRDLVHSQLDQEGVVVMEPPAIAVPKAAQDLGLKGLRALGLGVGADFVIWGSFTQIGTHYSLDAKIVESYSEAPPEAVYVEGEGVEGLLDSVRRLAQQIRMKILRLEKVVGVVIAGNKRIEAEAIKRIIRTKKGDVYSAKHIREDVKSIYRMGYFGDVRQVPY